MASPAVFAACGDDDSANGSGATAGRAGGGSTSGAGSGHAGTVSSYSGEASGAAGTSGGGTTSSGGKTGGAGTTGSGGKTGGGGPACEMNECLRANVCLDKCGGTVVYTGCCACEAPAVDELSCGAGGAGAGGSNSACGSATCDPDQTCVAHRRVGGAPILPNAGSCPIGKHVEGNTCVNDFAYACAALVDCAMPSATCQCAEASTCGYTDGCLLPNKAAWLDTDADLVCEQHAP
jgi:hypothetical protein